MNPVSNRRLPVDRFVVGVVAILPWISLLISLFSAENADKTIQVLRGEFTIHGIAYNPLRDFLPLFLLVNLAATAFAYGASHLSRSQRLTTTTEWYRVVAVIVLVLMSAVWFTLALGLASAASCLLRDKFLACSGDVDLALAAFVSSFFLMLGLNLIQLRGGIRSA